MDPHHFHADLTRLFCLSRRLSPLVDWFQISSFHNTMPFEGTQTRKEGGRNSCNVGYLLKSRSYLLDQGDRWLIGYVDSAPACYANTLQGSAIYHATRQSASAQLCILVCFRSYSSFKVHLPDADQHSAIYKQTKQTNRNSANKVKLPICFSYSSANMIELSSFNTF